MSSAVLTASFTSVSKNAYATKGICGTMLEAPDVHFPILSLRPNDHQQIRAKHMAVSYEAA